MAQSRGSSNGPDWKDVARAMLSFEESLSCTIRFTVRAGGTWKAPQLFMVATAEGTAGAPLAAKPLGSASVSMPGVGAGDLCAALLSLGYELDKDAYRKNEGLSSIA